MRGAMLLQTAQLGVPTLGRGEPQGIGVPLLRRALLAAQ
jgi:hypothetical protein